MRYALVPLFVIGVTCAALGNEAEKTWVKIKDDQAKFEVQFPEKPTEAPAKSGKGGKVLQLTRQKEAAVLLVTVSELNPAVDVDNAIDAKFLMDKVRQGLEKGMKGAKFVSEKDSKMDKRYPVRDIYLELPNFIIMRTRVILTPKRSYSLMVIGLNAYQEGKEARKFLESFKLMDVDKKKEHPPQP
jgi:hypothetical protein